MPTNGFGDLTASRRAWLRELDQMKTDMGLHLPAGDGVVRGFSQRLKDVLQRQEARRDRQVLGRPAFEEDAVIDFRRLMRAAS